MCVCVRERERVGEREREKDELAANEVSGCQLQWRPHLLAHNYPSFKDQLSYEKMDTTLASTIKLFTAVIS